jgi:formamidopyrimidine-DNA glycosylase
MPELPEVELIARSLDTIVKGRRIMAAELRRARLAPDTLPGDFAVRLRDRLINFVHRRGKHILVDLDGNTTLIVHLRMSGRFSLLDGASELPKFTHALFYLDGDDRLVFDDQRHFGLMKIAATDQLAGVKELKKLAPEPFSDEFSLAYFRNALKSSRRSLKEFLLDQTKVCGLGNIYASEAMFAAGVHPVTRACDLSKPKSGRLYDSLRTVLELAIAYGANLPVDPQNLEGNYFSANDEPVWQVYDRENIPCHTCATRIKRVTQGGRSTYYCPKCQRR